MNKDKKIVLIGDSAFAEIAYEYFTHDSSYEVVGFSVETEYLKRETLFGLPIVPFEKIEEFYDPNEVFFYAALVYTQLNRLRTRLYHAAKDKGFRPASYISSRAFHWSNVELGEHCFIFEDNTVQPFVKVGNNVILWSGNHIGHHSIIRDNCFISSHVVISGFCDIGENSFLGVNATLANNITIGKDNWISPNIAIMKNTDDASLFKVEQKDKEKVSATRVFKIKD